MERPKKKQASILMFATAPLCLITAAANISSALQVSLVRQSQPRACTAISYYSQSNASGARPATRPAAVGSNHPAASKQAASRTPPHTHTHIPAAWPASRSAPSSGKASAEGGGLPLGLVYCFLAYAAIRAQDK